MHSIMKALKSEHRTKHIQIERYAIHVLTNAGIIFLLLLSSVKALWCFGLVEAMYEFHPILGNP